VRGVAIVMMVIYHTAYDLTLFGHYQANVNAGAWRAFARVTASLFILLVGVTLVISHARVGHRLSGWRLYKKYLARGLKLVGWGMVITLVTWIVMGQLVIVFGILHLIGTATMLAYPFLSLRWANLVIGVAIIALGIHLNQLPVAHPWLLLLGLRPPALFQLDYFPLFPWFGVVLLGVFIGQQVYPAGRRRLDLPGRPSRPGLRDLAWLGQRSLVIYLIHQPILFAALNLVNFLSIGTTARAKSGRLRECSHWIAKSGAICRDLARILQSELSEIKFCEFVK
jgi:uncharacterized membrane protein